jgi:argininosuccinate lyase
MRFAPEYTANVLSRNFEDTRRLFLSSLMSIHYAHLVMLEAQRIVTADDAHALRGALDAISQAQVRSARYDGSDEDLFYYVERLVAEACGEEVAGRLHTARSRNDIDMTMYRMRLRDWILGLAAADGELRGALLDLADRHRDTVFAVHTHTQRAQPTTVAHYLLAVVEQLERDAARLRGAFERTNRSPLGACAITGTSFPIDRQLTADLLGFGGPTGNTYGSIASVDYLLEGVSTAGVLAAGLGRVVQDWLLWSTGEFDYLRLGDGFVQRSSIMPQKRNPVALEHARAICSSAVGQSQAIFTSVHNTPFGDIVDIEDDLQPMVASMFGDATRAVKLVAAAMRTAVFDAEALAQRASAGWTTLTELADTLVRDHRLAFRAAHAIAAVFMEERLHNPDRALSQSLEAASQRVIGRAVTYSDAVLRAVLDPRHFVEVRRTLGGPAPEETGLAIESSRRSFEADEAWLKAAKEAITDAERRLAQRAARL